MGGAQPLAGHDERRRLPHRRRRPGPAGAPRRPALPRRGGRRPRRRPRPVRAAKAERRPLSVGLAGNCARCSPSCCAAACPSTSSPTRPPRTTRCPTCLRVSAVEDWHAYAEAKPEEFTDRARAVDGHARRGHGRLHGRRRRGVRLRQLDPRRGQAARLRARLRLPRLRAGVHPAAVLRGQGPVPLGRALRRPGRHRGDRPRRARPLPRQRAAAPAGSRAAEKVAFQGLPARICWLGYGERDKAGVRFNDMVAAGEVSAPIVIGRDHLDCGSVASPYRETESMLDGSDAIADWPLLNAMRQHRVRRLLGVDPPRWRRGHRSLDPRRSGDRGRRHRRWPARRSSVSSPTTRAWA